MTTDGQSPPPLPPSRPAQGARLSEADYLLVRRASLARKSVQRVVTVAGANAVMELGVGILALLVTVFWWSWAGLLVGLALCAVGAVELAGRKRVRMGDASGASLLALNQLAFLAVIIIYCVAQMVGTPAQAVNDAIGSELRELSEATGTPLGDVEQSVTAMARWFYLLIILLSVAFQGGMALYYFTRRKAIEQFNRETPEWVRRLLKAGGA